MPSAGDVAKHPFPFLTSGELEAVRARRLQGGTRDGAGRRLIDGAERMLNEKDFVAVLDGAVATNLFVVQSLLFETSLAFLLTGQERFVEPVRRIVASLVDDDYRRTRLPSEVHLGFTLPALGVAAQLCHGSIDLHLVQKVAVSMGIDLATSAGTAPWGRQVPRRAAWNHTAVGFTGLGCAGLLCPDGEQSTAWTELALDRVKAFFRDGITESGMTREGLHYAGFVFRSLAPFLLACRNLGLFDYRDVADNPYLERLRRVPGWYATQVFPAGSWLQNLNDSHWDPRRAMGGFLPLFGPLDPPAVVWVHRELLGVGGSGDHGQDRRLVESALFESALFESAPRPAEDLAARYVPPEHFADPDTGYLAEHVRHGVTGPATDGGYGSGFSLTCGPFLPGIHGQSDAGSVTLFFGAVPVLIDCGAANDPTEGSPSSSYGHNVMLVGERGQRPSGRGRGVCGVIVRARRASEATVVTCDLAAAYKSDDYNPVHHAVRHCVFAKRPFPYLLVVDDMARPDRSRSTFRQLFHTPPAHDIRRGPGEVDFRLEFSGEVSRVLLRGLDRCTVTQRTVALSARPWPEHALWILERHCAGGPMASLILPYRPGDGSAPVVQGMLDARRGQVMLRWRHGADQGVDLLGFRPGRARPATLLRDGRRLLEATTVLRTGASARLPDVRGLLRAPSRRRRG